MQQVTGTARQLVGPGKLIDPVRIAKVWVSPRKRTQQTFQLLFSAAGPDAEKVTFTEDIAEWDYGIYEGLRSSEIKSLRMEKGLDESRDWNIWRDGCEDGESVPSGPQVIWIMEYWLIVSTYRSAEMVTERLDRLIQQIRIIQQPHMDGLTPADVVLVGFRHCSSSNELTSPLAGCTWPCSACFREKMAKVPS